MQDKQDKDKKDKKSRTSKDRLPKLVTNETFALAGGEINLPSGTTIPPEEGVRAAKEFVEDNKK